MKIISSILLIFTICHAMANASDDISEKLMVINSKIVNEPNNPVHLYRKAQLLTKSGQYNDGYNTAKQAFELYKRLNTELSWMLIDSINIKDYRIDVLLNMGERERNPPSIGIIKPLTFRIWSNGKDGKLIDVVDYETAMFDGSVTSVAFGKTNANGHINYGVLEKNLDYEQMRSLFIKLAIKIINKNNEAQQGVAPEPVMHQ